MKNKPDIGQDDSDETLYADTGSSVRVLRGNLLAMSKPFPVSIKQIFKMENTFQALEVRPKAVSLQGLEQSETLSQSLQKFPFTEADLISGTESNIARSPTAMKKVPPAGRREKTNYTASPAVRKTMPAGGYAEAKQKDFAPAQSSRQPRLNQTDTDAQQTTPQMPDGDFLTPGFMQQWIEEILIADKTANNTAESNNHSLSDRHHSKTRDSSRLDNIKYRPANVLGLPGHEKKLHDPIPKKPGMGGGFDKGGPRKRIDANPLSGSPQARRNKFSPTEANSQISQRKSSLGASMHASPQIPVTVFEGIALLQSMTQAELSNNREASIRNKSTNHAPATADIASRINNPVWPQKIEKNARPASSSVRGDSENRIDSASTTTTTTTTDNRQKTTYHDESERIATLLNDALEEQAIRHGVDLS